MTELEAVEILRKHRATHAIQHPNALMTDEALKMANKALNQMARFHQLTDADDSKFTYEVGFLRKWILEGKDECEV